MKHVLHKWTNAIMPQLRQQSLWGPMPLSCENFALVLFMLNKTPTVVLNSRSYKLAFNSNYIM